MLRKNITSFKNEVDPLTGIFTNLNGIVSSFNKFSTNTYRYPPTSNYDYKAGWISTRPMVETDGAVEWGNPVGEMMYETLRYFAGKATPTSAFSITSSDTPDATLGLPVATWLDPYKTVANGGGGFLSCAKPIQMVISDINVSYDTDQIPGSYFNSFAGDLSGLNVSTLADSIWSQESESNRIFIGQSGSVGNGAPDPKPASSFKDIRGLAPEEPTKQGGYYSASVALFGRSNDLNAISGNQKATTLSVALASPLPRIIIPVANSTVTLVPFAKSTGGAGIDPAGSFQPTDQIADFYVDQIVNTTAANTDTTINGGRPYGKFRINYEDNEQAADFDMDAISAYTFTVTADNKVIIQMDSQYAAGGIIQHMGYVISGTSTDGVYLEVRDSDTGSTSDVDYFLDTPPGQLPGGLYQDGVALPLSATRTFTPGNTTSASFVNHDPLWYAAKWGSNDKNEDGFLQQKEWDENGDGTPDGYFLVTNAGNLPAQLSSAFLKALTVVSSASAVAANSTRLDVGTAIYQAKFNTSDWSGQLQTYTVDTITGALTTGWEASDLIPSEASRKIYTFAPAAPAGSKGVPFLWANLSKDTDIPAPVPYSQQRYLDSLSGAFDGLGADRLSWIRGNVNEELDSGGVFRNRTNLLGDIVNSDPSFVGHEDYGYSVLPGSEGSSYNSFTVRNKNRRPMVYVGANDGMMHGFDATVGTGGKEIFAYIPNSVFPTLSNLPQPSYVHQYYVDGLSSVGDTYDGSSWHTLLVGTLGGGGRGAFALDVTSPDGFGASSVLWEFTSNDDVDLGYTFAQPAIGRTEDGHWVTFLANGYNSDNGHAVLFVLDALTGAVLSKIDTGVGDPANKNGLSSPIAVDVDNNKSIDRVYAGDLYGNLWEFNFSGSVGAWSVANGGQPLFVACTANSGCSASNRQPITSKPNVGPTSNPTSGQNGQGVMVYFGTGKYFETGDNIVSNSPQVQSFYGLWDNGSTITRSQLQPQTIIYEGTTTTVDGASTKPVRVVSANTVCYSANTSGCTASSTLYKGWVLNLIPPTNIAQGERSVSFPLLRRGLVVFSTLIPQPDPCTFGGSSWLMEVDAVTGGEFNGGPNNNGSGGAPFDTNGDGIADSHDTVIINGQAHFAGGVDVGVGIFKTPAVIESTNVDFKYVSGSSGQIGTVYDGCVDAACANAGNTGTRRSWRQLR